MASDRWSSDNNIAFMKLYREQENLWNCFDKNYRNRDMRKASLECIAKEMHLCNTIEVTKKIKNLRSTYNQELNKIEKSKKSGAGVDDVYKPSIKWFDIMDYIMTTINLKEKKTTSNLVSALFFNRLIYIPTNTRTNFKVEAYSNRMLSLSV